MTFRYLPRGVCSREILLDLSGDRINSVQVMGGCSGNLQGISRLVAGMKMDDAIAKLEGIRCGRKGTSCPDQIAQALKAAKARE
ncbi:MAG: TIGR03905 family TSCPD domain-containing protein [Oscillospiraceae bacterium]|nr:TIGR03905 family TSCPD domain-containing protein [Oscillospiraceae bacterium]